MAKSIGEAFPSSVTPVVDVAPAANAPPASALEERIASVWCELLGLSQVAPTESFFDLGGHSLLAVQVQRRLSMLFGHQITLTDIFRFPTVRSLAGYLDGKTSDTGAVDAGQARASARLMARNRGRTTPAQRAV